MQADELKVWIALAMCVAGLVSTVYFFWAGWNEGFFQEYFNSKEKAIDFIEKSIKSSEKVEARNKVVNIFTEEDLGVRNGKTD